MTRLSFDAEMWRRGITSVPLPPGTRAEIESDLQARLLDLLAAGVDVVLASPSGRVRCVTSGEDYWNLWE